MFCYSELKSVFCSLLISKCMHCSFHIFTAIFIHVNFPGYIILQEELERFERKQRGKKRRPRKQVEEIVEPSWFQQHIFTILMASVAVGLIAGLFLIAMD